MNTEKLLFGTGETIEILDAAYSALDYALMSAEALEMNGDEARASLKKSMNAVKAASSKCDSPGPLKGQVANALAHLRGSLKSMQEYSDDENFASVIRASARALSLLYPITQKEGPILLVPRKNPKRTRRRLGVGNFSRRARPLSFEVDLRYETDTNFFTGFERDISFGGLFIATYDIHPAGTRLIVNVKMPGGRVLSENATVSWVREYKESSIEVVPGMGVVFNDISDRSRSEINAYLASRDTIFYEAV